MNNLKEKAARLDAAVEWWEKEHVNVIEPDGSHKCVCDACQMLRILKGQALK